MPDVVVADCVELCELASEAHPVVERFYRAQGYKLRCGRQERILVIRDQHQEILAAARLLPHVNGYYWLRNMLVAKAWRGRGLGRQMVQAIPGVLGSSTGCYCFALPQVVAFYHALGFYTREALPPSVICPPAILAQFHTYKSRGRDWALMFMNLPLP
ncbi:GNAT family N-acetyltransferase [Cellvibrio japonicus]|uniref:Acetyltransferase, GNAT family n=1 Tax=Cellvibrio japonicus (strain Ueda107) TaxID=498211 RepID=B3PKG5_CELJU|nr:GNAT family N-acetyltransferase [Cellvibrio japonicus]ACE85836.1 acetyltransferase, GNAT family [Cellvibrio japonicus Ueda107]QEI12832.1 GNAT family N-acetyltransferase [Cellvibrio japonicus]QEI16406.1 GNAT family N-acetyltransferase [Cellvibrio japonicus]QEI19984.1 GNAT family N-acetyltransferase [Cellvibrio japonicus]